MVTLANSTPARGFAVDLVVARLGGMYGAYLSDVSSAVNIVDLKAPRLILSVPALVAYFRRTPPDACLSAINQANVLAIIARKLAGKQFRPVISERNSSINEVQGTKLRNLVLTGGESFHSTTQCRSITSGASRPSRFPRSARALPRSF